MVVTRAKHNFRKIKIPIAMMQSKPSKEFIRRFNILKRFYRLFPNSSALKTTLNTRQNFDISNYPVEIIKYKFNFYNYFIHRPFLLTGCAKK